MPNYRIEVYKRAAFTERGTIDEFASETERESETSATDWQHCLEVARILARAHPDRIVAAYDAERAELDTDGLSDEEREEVMRVVEEARATEVACD